MKVLFAIFILGVILTRVTKCDDDDDDIEELCQNSDDARSCIRSYFKDNAECSVVDQVDDSSVYWKETNNAYVPKINLTMGLTETYLSNFNGSIERFFFNKKSKNLVMSIQFDGIQLDSKEIRFIIHQRSKEPKVIIERAYGTYPVILTAVIPVDGKITAETIKNGTTSAYVPVPIVSFYIGPKIILSKDPVVIKMALSLIAHVPTVLQELFLSAAHKFFVEYLQKYYCDFDIAVSKLYK